MALEIRQQLRQTQLLVMTPQLQQAIRLLQYNHLEMLSALQAELKENPVLEVASLDDPFTDQESAERNDLKALEDMVKEPEPPPRPDMFEVEWENYLESYGGDYAPVQRDNNDRPPLEAMCTYKQTLFHYLLEQLQMSHIEDVERKIALEIIGNVNEDGFLDLDLQELSQRLGVSLEHVEEVLAEVQNFDPIGVASRNLRECLLKQARAMDPSHEIVVRILEELFELFEQGKFEHVARRLKISLDEVKQAAKIISSFDPRPGRQFMNSDTIYVVPDIFVIKSGDDYTVVLNDDGLPRLRISSLYNRALHSNSSSSAAKNYIQEKVRGAMWLIKSIHQRQRTIYKVTQSIIKFQREFFDKGIDYLKPLILKDVADDIEMHESTISRVTTNKYVHTPRGIFELKFFFNSGLPHGAESIASEAVKNHIARIVKNENPDKPASDKQIVEELERTQIHIARRTVAKYREILGIPPSSKRRKKF
jgi:RNA polymerase sigma-54 factor